MSLREAHEREVALVQGSHRRDEPDRLSRGARPAHGGTEHGPSAETVIMAPKSLSAGSV